MIGLAFIFCDSLSFFSFFFFFLFSGVLYARRNVNLTCMLLF